MKNRIVAILVASALAILAAISVASYSETPLNIADALNSLGLFEGRGDTEGYALDKTLTRAEGVTLIVRLIGKDEEATANKDNYTTPFVDVPDWAKGYVGYAYENKITNGVWTDRFGPDIAMTDNMFITLVLRMLGYSDSAEEAKYTWDNPYEFAEDLGLIDSDKPDDTFTRAKTIEVFWNALKLELADEDITLAESLIEQGVFTTDEYQEAKEICRNGKPTESDDTTVVPDDTTTVPEDTTVVPDDTTTVPDDTTAVPDDTIVIPKDPDEGTII